MDLSSAPAKTLFIFTVRLAFVFAFWFAFAGKLFLIYYSSTNAEKRPSAKKKKPKGQKAEEYYTATRKSATRNEEPKTVFGARELGSQSPRFSPVLVVLNAPRRRVRRAVFLVGQWWTQTFVVARALF